MEAAIRSPVSSRVAISLASSNRAAISPVPAITRMPKASRVAISLVPVIISQAKAIVLATIRTPKASRAAISPVPVTASPASRAATRSSLDSSMVLSVLIAMPAEATIILVVMALSSLVPVVSVLLTTIPMPSTR